MSEQEELYAPRVRGNCKPSGYQEYDSLTGYVVDRYSLEWTDDFGNVWRKTCTVVNLGRPDRGKRICSQPEDESLLHEGKQATVSRERWQEIKRGREDELFSLVLPMLQQEPRSAYRIGKALGVSNWRVLDILRQRPDTFVYLGGHKRRWGIVGVHEGVSNGAPES